MSYAEKAQEIWQGMTKNEKHGVRFGVFPYYTMKAAEGAGFNHCKLTVALMDVAQADGGRRA